MLLIESSVWTTFELQEVLLLLFLSLLVRLYCLRLRTIRTYPYSGLYYVTTTYHCFSTKLLIKSGGVKTPPDARESTACLKHSLEDNSLFYSETKSRFHVLDGNEVTATIVNVK